MYSSETPPTGGTDEPDDKSVQKTASLAPTTVERIGETGEVPTVKTTKKVAKKAASPPVQHDKPHPVAWTYAQEKIADKTNPFTRARAARGKCTMPRCLGGDVILS